MEIINAGSQVSHTNLRYGAWKWSKPAYRTGRGFTSAFPAPTNWSPDSALTIRLPDGRVYGRHSTVPVKMASNHTLYRWALGYAWIDGAPPVQTNVAVDTGLWWHQDWILQLHRYTAHQPVEFRLGGYALPLSDSRPSRDESTDAFGVWDRSGAGSVVQLLAGLTERKWAQRLDPSTPRVHLATPFHATPVATQSQAEGSGWLVALTWTGADRAAAQPWNVVRTDPGHWQLNHPQHGKWQIDHAFLPRLDLPATAQT
ncbi:MAG: hypothetical protein J6386_03805 [Candidatus Synoicihabitans palmerolidicus]|nr:hypothetical protein [Candidatus Synoicihabitans palmerolidicus]